MSKLEKPAQIVPVFYVIDVFADTAGAVSLQKGILRQAAFRTGCSLRAECRIRRGSGWLRNNGYYDKIASVMKMEMLHRKPNRIPGYDYSQSGAYFITICTQDRKRILSRISVGTPLPGCPEIPHDKNGHPGTGVPTVELLWHGEIAQKYIRQMDAFYGQLSVDQYVIMPDHIHLLITIRDGHPGRGVPTRTSEIARFVGTFKRFCNKEYGGNIWQSRYYDHVVRNQQDYNEIWEYIENNPTKWASTKDMV